MAWGVFCGDQAVRVIDHFFLQRKQQRETACLELLSNLVYADEIKRRPGPVVGSLLR